MDQVQVSTDMAYPHHQPPRAARRPRLPDRRGAVAMLAMLYLILFATMAIGFYAAVTTASQTSMADQRVTRAYLAAETGMDFMRQRLAQVSIPAGTPPTTVGSTKGVLDVLYDQLSATLNDQTNFKDKPIAKVGNSIRIPGDLTQRVDIDADSGFRATIDDMTGEIVVTIVGRYGTTNVGRAFAMNYTRTQKQSTVFDYAVAAKGRVVMSKGSITGVAGVSDDKVAQVMSAKGTLGAITMSGGTIGSATGGQLNVSLADESSTLTIEDLAKVTGGSVHGSSIASNILNNYTKVVDKPEFPIIDTSIYKPYATNTYAGESTLKNVRIPAGTNPKFTGGATIQGILYIESPNTVEFRGNTQLQGFIVFENKGSTAVNVIDQRGNFSHMPLPSGPEYDGLRSTSGLAVLAPTTRMLNSGSVDSDLKGNVVLGTFANAGSADWTIQNGSMLLMDDSVDSAIFNGKTVKFASTGAPTLPTGVMSFSSYFTPDPKTYQEVLP
jgi:hypothetical protein